MLLEKCKNMLGASAFQGEDTILVALSGGRDSVSLFHALLELYKTQPWHQEEIPKFSLAVAHLNHQNRGEDSWIDANFVEEIMEPYKNHVEHHIFLTDAHNNRILGPDGQPQTKVMLLPPIPLYLRHMDVPAEAKAQKRGFEVVAREIRYAFLEEIRQKANADWIAVAHNASDNAETMLFHLARGCGLTGLSGMLPVNGRILRPLLGVTRREIDQFLKERGIVYHEDSTNASLTYARNRIRHQVLPQLEIINSKYLDHFHNTMSIIQEEDGYLNQLVAESLDVQREAGSVEVSVSALLTLPPPLRQRGVQYLASQLSSNIVLTLAQRKQVLHLAEREKPSGRLHLPQQLQAEREYEVLRFLLADPQSSLVMAQPGSPTPLLLGEPVLWRGWRILLTEKIYQPKASGLWLCHQEGIFLRSRESGDYLRLSGRGGKSLKKWLIQEKIPLKQRDEIPVFITQSNQLMAVGNLGSHQDFLPVQGELAYFIQLSREHHYDKLDTFYNRKAGYP